MQKNNEGSFQQSLENIEKIIYKDPDSLSRMLICNGQVRVFMARCTRLAQVASDTHLASDVASAAMGRVLCANAFLSNMIKEDEGNVSLIFSGDGIGGKIISVGEKNRLRISVQNPQAEMEKLPDGRLDVEGFVGRNGRITVIKDMGRHLAPYIGHADIVSGGIGEDMANYFTVSEQTPSLVAVGCLNQDGIVLSCGGIFIQPLPGCPDEILRALEMRIPFFANISRELFDRSIEQLASLWFRDMDLVFLGETRLSYACNCSREKMEKALLASGKDSLEEMLSEGKDIEMQCHFCRNRQIFRPDDIRALMQEKSEV